MPKMCTPPEIFAPPLCSNRKSALASFPVKLGISRDYCILFNERKYPTRIEQVVGKSDDSDLEPPFTIMIRNQADSDWETGFEFDIRFRLPSSSPFFSNTTTCTQNLNKYAKHKGIRLDY